MGAMRKSIHTAEYAALVKELKRLRSAAKLTQRELATRLSVAPSWVAKVESAERRIDVIELCSLLMECGADPKAVVEQVARNIARSRRSGVRS